MHTCRQILHMLRPFGSRVVALSLLAAVGALPVATPRPVRAQSGSESSWTEFADVSPEMQVGSTQVAVVKTVQPAAEPAAINLLSNGSFELAEPIDPDDPLRGYGWNIGGVKVTAVDQVFTSNSFPEPHGLAQLGIMPPNGLFALSFGVVDTIVFNDQVPRYPVVKVRAWQYLYLPIGERATLRFQHQILAKHATCGQHYAHVVVRELMHPAQKLATFELCQPNHRQGWREAQIDLSAYMGKHLFVQLEAELHNLGEVNNNDDAVAWLVDTAELVVEAVPSIPDTAAHRQYLPAIQRVIEAPAPFVFTCNPSQGSGGRSAGIYQTEVAGLKAIVGVGKNYDASKPTFLAFYMHGDNGGYDYFHRYPPIRRLIDDRGWVYVSVQAPNLDGEPYISWKEGDYEEKAHRFAAVLEEMYAHYNVCRGALLGAGASGGSVAATRAFLPLLADRYPTAFFADCGGTYPPDHATAASADMGKLLQIYGQTPEIAGRIGVSFQYSPNDFVAAEVERAIAGYSSHDIRVDVIKTNSPGHCGSDPSQPARDYWIRIADQVRK